MDIITKDSVDSMAWTRQAAQHVQTKGDQAAACMDSLILIPYVARSVDDAASQQVVKSAGSTSMNIKKYPKSFIVFFRCSQTAIVQVLEDCKSRKRGA
jgi:hypothetical protein